MVSVVMSVRNGERTVRQAVESILGQTLRDLTLVVVEDGSTDDTWTLLQAAARHDERLILLRNERNVGLTRSLNRGLAHATGEFVARQDADDSSEPERIERQIAFLRAHPDVGLLGTGCRYVVESGADWPPYVPPATDTAIRWRLPFDNPFVHTSIVVRRGLLAGEGGAYDESLPYAQDYELWIRLLRRTRGANLPEPLVTRRIGWGCVTETRRAEQHAIGVRLALGQVNALLPPGLAVSETDLERLRRWYFEMPPIVGENDFPLCERFVALAGAFNRQRAVDSAEGRALIRQTVQRVWYAIPDYRLRTALRNGLFRRSLVCAPVTTMRLLRERVGRRMRRRAASRPSVGDPT
jgi:hypothetical protein